VRVYRRSVLGAAIGLLIVLAVAVIASSPKVRRRTYVWWMRRKVGPGPY
jgi:hypothetical protein